MPAQKLPQITGTSDAIQRQSSNMIQFPMKKRVPSLSILTVRTHSQQQKQLPVMLSTDEVRQINNWPSELEKRTGALSQMSEVLSNVMVNRLTWHDEHFGQGSSTIERKDISERDAQLEKAS
jgi:hypothetical protein